jgi:hypothetical protein
LYISIHGPTTAPIFVFTFLHLNDSCYRILVNMKTLNPTILIYNLVLTRFNLLIKPNANKVWAIPTSPPWTFWYESKTRTLARWPPKLKIEINFKSVCSLQPVFRFDVTLWSFTNCLYSFQFAEWIFSRYDCFMVLNKLLLNVQVCWQWLPGLNIAQ